MWLLNILTRSTGASHIAYNTESTFQCRRHKRYKFDPSVGMIPWSRKWQSTPIFLPRKFRGQRSLTSYSSWSFKESNMTEQLSTHTHTHTHTHAHTHTHTHTLSSILKTDDSDKDLFGDCPKCLSFSLQN